MQQLCHSEAIDQLARAINNRQAPLHCSFRNLTGKAKRGLGERGPTWWKGRDYNRYLAKYTPYAKWFVALMK